MGKKFIARFLAPAAVVAALTPIADTAVAFNWPKDADTAVKFDVISQEITNVSNLISAIYSQKPIGAKAYAVVNLENGKTLFQQDAAAAYPVASTAKLMTAVVALENIEMGKTIEITNEMLAAEGTTPAIYHGLEISADDLLHAALIQSVNDAAEALAQFTGREAFVALMNKKAKSLGMNNTVYYDPTGLNPKNKSSAADMAKLMAYIYENHPQILEITKDADFWLKDENDNPRRFLNLNDFYIFPEFEGGKSGYLAEAGNTFASVFKINKKPIAIILFNSGNYRSDIFRLINLVNE